MEEKDANLKILKESIKELLDIVEQADALPKESLQIQTYFIAKRSKICELGKRIATLAGLESDSMEAFKFGKMIVSNYIWSNLVSIDFLREVQADEELKHTLKKEIMHFVKIFMNRLEEDRKSLQIIIKKEKEILKKLKYSEKAAKDNPIWAEDIEALETKIRNISILISNKAETEQETPKIQKGDKEDKENKTFIDLLDTLSRFVFFCTFKQSKRASKYDLLREIALHLFESEGVRYISVIPYVCQAGRKINIEMCSPNGLDMQFIPWAKKYIKYIFTEFKRSFSKSVSKSIKTCLTYYKETGEYKKEHIEKVFVGCAPERGNTIKKTMSSYNDTVFYINVIRLIYLVIHDFAYNSLIKHGKAEQKDLSSIIIRENRIYHKGLIKKWIGNARQDHSCTNSKSNNSPSGAGSLYPILTDSLSISNSFVLVRTISYGIFTDENILSEYYREYHPLKTSVLRTLLDIISKKIAVEVYAQMQNIKQTNKEMGKSRVKKQDPSKELVCLVRRRILNTLHILAIRLIKSKSIKVRTYVSNIDFNEFEKRGLPAHHTELYMFLSLALPLFAFSVSILDGRS